jgi:serine/threonine-protein kinase
VGSPPQLRADMAAALGLIAYNRGRYDEARRQLERALALSEKLHGRSHVDVARAHTNLGNLERALGRYDDAIAHHRKAMAIDRTLRGEGHPVLGRHHHNIAGVLRLQGFPGRALEHYRKALALERAAYGDDHPEVAMTHNSIGLVHFDLGDMKSARASIERALKAFRKSEHGETGVALHNLGLVLAAEKNHRDALVRFSEALVAYERVHGSEHERVARVLIAMGRSALALGQRADATDHFRRALRIAAKHEDMKDIAEDARSRLAGIGAGRRAKPARPSPPATPKPRPTAPVYGPSQGWD